MILKIRNFEFDSEQRELSRNGKFVPLERIPRELLALLIDRRDRIVTREEIVRTLWGPHPTVDVDNSINTAVRKLRRVLGDRPGKAVFIRTMTARGYRFVAPVEAVVSGDVTAQGHRGRIMLAVLPFQNLSSLPDHQYFADGLTEETINHLGQIDPQALGVIARTSSMAYQRTTKSIAEIARELRVDYLIESSLRADQATVRITSQLIRASDQTHIWSGSFDREVSSFLGVQRDLGIAIAQAVRLKLDPASGAARATAPDAWDLYLRGLFYWNQLTPPAIRRAQEHFRGAIAIDPEYALAYSGLADSYAFQPVSCDAPPLEVLPLALAAASRAVALADTLADGHASLGAVRMWMEWNWSASEASLRRALALNPSNVNARRWYAILLSDLGRFRESAEQMAAALDLDPRSPLTVGLAGALLNHAGQDDRALGYVQQALALNPALWVLHLWAGRVYERLGRFSEAIENLQFAFDHSGGNTEALALKSVVNARMGNRFEAEQALGLLTSAASSQYVPPACVALAFAALGRPDEALAWLERAYEARDVRLTWLAVEPRWDCLRSDVRFQQLLERMRLPRMAVRPGTC